MKVFFQSSMPRSGSTLLQNIMAQNPDFYATPTSGLVELIHVSRNMYTNGEAFKAQNPEEMKKAFLSYCKKGVEGYFEGITDKKYVMDKSRGWIGIHPFVNMFYPGVKMVCMVRDMKDIYCSMEKNYRKNPDKDSGVVNNNTLTGTTTQKRVELWSNTNPVGSTVEKIYQTIAEKNNDILFVRYETLCSEPDRVMNIIYQYLEIPYYEHDFKNVEQRTVENDRIYGIYGDHTIRQEVKPLESTALEILGEDTCNWIDNQYDWYNQIFQYNV